MPPFERLDAWKVCHELVLAIHRTIKSLPESKREDAVLYDLMGTAVRASAKLARGSGMRHRKLFQRCADRAAGHLTELAYHLEMARHLDILPKDKCGELDALRGRALFYTYKLLFSVGPNPEA